MQLGCSECWYTRLVEIICLHILIICQTNIWRIDRLDKSSSMGCRCIYLPSMTLSIFKEIANLAKCNFTAYLLCVIYCVSLFLSIFVSARLCVAFHFSFCPKPNCIQNSGSWIVLYCILTVFNIEKLRVCSVPSKKLKTRLFQAAWEVRSKRKITFM